MLRIFLHGIPEPGTGDDPRREPAGLEGFLVPQGVDGRSVFHGGAANFVLSSQRIV